jgi:hypothetical protein
MKLYDKAAAQLSVTTAGQLTRLQEHYDSYAKLAAKSKEILEMRTREYLASGVAYNCLAFQQAMAITGTDPKGYFKALAKELSRPFVYASDEKTHGYYGGTYKYHDYAQLIVPATNRLKNVVAGLNLVARTNATLGEGHDVICQHSDRTWRFMFDTDSGREVLADFITTCRTNPVMRITLGVKAVTLGGNNDTAEA